MIFDDRETMKVNNEFIEKMKEWRQIGSMFFYLGHNCCVTGYYKTELIGFYGVRIPRLTANYCDNHGVIRQLEFSKDEIIALMAADE